MSSPSSCCPMQFGLGALVGGAALSAVEAVRLGGESAKAADRGWWQIGGRQPECFFTLCACQRSRGCLGVPGVAFCAAMRPVLRSGMVRFVVLRRLVPQQSGSQWVALRLSTEATTLNFVYSSDAVGHAGMAHGSAAPSRNHATLRFGGLFQSAPWQTLWHSFVHKNRDKFAP